MNTNSCILFGMRSVWVCSLLRCSCSTQARDSGPVHRDPPLSRPPPVVQDTPRLLKVLLDPTQPTKVTEVTYFIGAGNKLLHMDPLGKGSMVEVTEEAGVR